MSISGAFVVIIRYAARSSRMRRRSACGGSPPTDLMIRSKWKREKWCRAAQSSPLASWSSSALGEAVDELGEGVGGDGHDVIVPPIGGRRLDPACSGLAAEGADPLVEVAPVVAAYDGLDDLDAAVGAGQRLLELRAAR